MSEQEHLHHWMQRHVAPLPSQPALAELVEQGLAEIEFPEDFISGKKELPPAPPDLTSYAGARAWAVTNCEHNKMFNIPIAASVVCLDCMKRWTYEEYNKEFFSA